MKRAWFLRLRGGCPTRGGLWEFAMSRPPIYFLLYGSSYYWVVVGVVGLSVLAHVPTPPADSSSSCHVRKEVIFPFSPLSHDSILPFMVVFHGVFFPISTQGMEFPILMQGRDSLLMHRSEYGSFTHVEREAWPPIRVWTLSDLPIGLCSSCGSHSRFSCA